MVLELWSEHEAEQLDATVLAERLIVAIDAVAMRSDRRGLPIAVFGSGQGGAAAVIAAARRPQLITAVVSRGARLDLAGDDLAAIRVPTMLIVGSGDRSGLRLHRNAMRAMVRAPALVVIPGANQRFEQPGALDEVAEIAAIWLLERFGVSRPVGRATG